MEAEGGAQAGSIMNGAVCVLKLLTHSRPAGDCKDLLPDLQENLFIHPSIEPWIDLPHLSQQNYLLIENTHGFRIYEPCELFQSWDLPFQKFPLIYSCIHLTFIELIPIPGIVLNDGDGVASKNSMKKRQINIFLRLQ